MGLPGLNQVFTPITLSLRFLRGDTCLHQGPSSEEEDMGRVRKPYKMDKQAE